MLQFYEHLCGVKRLYETVSAPVEEEFSLTGLEFHVLMFLANNPQFDRASDIVRCRGFTKSHVSITVRSLMERGLITGEHGSGDRRTVHLKLCPAAERIVARGREAQEEFYKTLTKGLTAEDLEQMRRCFLIVEKNVKEKG